MITTPGASRLVRVELGAAESREPWPGALALWRLIFGAWLWSAFLGGAASPAAAGERKLESYTQAIPGTTVAIEMVAIPGCEATLGSPGDEAGREPAEPAPQRVSVEPFWLGRYEVTWEQFLPFVFADRADLEKEKADGVTHPSKPLGSVYRDRGETGYPAIGMSRKTAVEFCKWLRFKTGRPYRLPTEAEWEYACRAGAATPYAWGEDGTKAGDYAWFKDNAKGTTQPVGKKAPNKFGLHDIVGNVAEWCAPEAGGAPAVVRGGAFSEPVTRLRSAARMLETPEWNELDPRSPPGVWWLSAADFVGIRLAYSSEDRAASPKAEKPAGAAVNATPKP